ncbi:hypothetical protein MPER_05187 [Moniliophthora perniciosa FA553]|nr:hypothetical protein MPER_05187 [Moniliophthora perniciosa FA553]
MALSTAPTGVFANPPSRTAELDETWAFLDKGVDHIMNRLEEGMTFPNYTALYTTVYNFCTSAKMTSKPGDHKSGANLVGVDLYNTSEIS